MKFLWKKIREILDVLIPAELLSNVQQKLSNSRRFLN